jgi:hypothetical protein
MHVSKKQKVSPPAQPSASPSVHLPINNGHLRLLKQHLPQDNLRQIFLEYNKKFWKSPVNQLVLGAFDSKKRVSYSLRVSKLGLAQGTSCFCVRGGEFGTGASKLLLTVPAGSAVTVAAMEKLTGAVMAALPRMHIKLAATLIAGDAHMGDYGYRRTVRGNGGYDDVRAKAYVARLLLRFLYRHDVPVSSNTHRAVITAARQAGLGDSIPSHMVF